jgi:hypothetical protein
MTVDKSWFYHITDAELRWFPPDGTVPDLERVTVQSRENDVHLVWGPTGFSVVTALESGCKFNATYDVSKVKIGSSEW